MIENTSASKNPASGEFVDVRKYIGVASVNVIAVNPDNEKLRRFGWNIPEGADEPVYVTTRTDENGKETKSARVRFLVQIKDMEEKPIVPLDFWCRPELSVNKSGDKYKIIDAYGRTAWGTKQEISSKKIPVYSNGQQANISTPYRLCHPGEEELVQFLLKYLNITPFQTFDKNKQTWVNTKNPGRLTIDNWDAICAGNTKELAGYLALQPENCVKVILGLRTTDDNKSYQTFLNSAYIGNGASPDRNTGEYATARKVLDRFFENHRDSPYSFSATPVKEWKETASVVEDNSNKEFNPFNTASTVESEDDLPF